MGAAYLVVIFDGDTPVSADIWSSPEWQQSRHMEQTVLIAYFVVGFDNFDIARKRLLEAVSSPYCIRYKRWYDLLPEQSKS